MNGRINIFNMSSLPKPLLFGGFAAVGCLLGAILGEALLNVTQAPALPPVSHELILLIDSSGSMEGKKLQEVKLAAIEFIKRRQSSFNNFGVISFGNVASEIANFNTDLISMEEKINNLKSGGGTPMAHALKLAISKFSSISEQQSILIFTDGKPNEEEASKVAAEVVRKANINIVAVATDDADILLLNKITADPLLVFSTSLGNFDSAFKLAEKAIYERNIITSSPIAVTETSLIYTSLRIGSWTILLVLGIALALIISQNLYLRRRSLTVSEGLIAVVSCIIIGLIAGGVGQLLYGLVPENPNLDIFSRIIAWSILGVLLGRGVAFFIPNLKAIPVMISGGIGGAIAASGFLSAAYMFADIPARLLGAIILGFAIGLMVGITEYVKKAWLIVHWGPKDSSIINLGDEPILVGSSNKAHVYLPKSQNFPAEMGTITFVGGEISFHNKATGKKQVLRDGNKWDIGSVTIEVRALEES